MTGILIFDLLITLIGNLLVPVIIRICKGKLSNKYAALITVINSIIFYILCNLFVLIITGDGNWGKTAPMFIWGSLAFIILSTGKKNKKSNTGDTPTPNKETPIVTQQTPPSEMNCDVVESNIDNSGEEIQKSKRKKTKTLLLCIIPSVIIVLGLTAVFVSMYNAKYHKISFHTYGGTEIADRRVDVIQISPTTIKQNYNFVGWYFDESLTLDVNFPLSVDTDMVLYAKWKETKESKMDRLRDYLQSIGGTYTYSDYSDSIRIDIKVNMIGNTVNYEITRTYNNGKTNPDEYYVTINYMSLSFEFGNVLNASGVYSNHTTFGRTIKHSCEMSIDSVYLSGTIYKPRGDVTSYTVDGINKTKDNLYNDLVTSFHDYLVLCKYSVPVTVADSVLFYE